MSKFTVQNLLADLEELQIGTHYKYVKLQGGNVPANECIFKGVDPQTRIISYSRGVSPNEVEVISSGTFDIVVRALLAGTPCNLDVVLQGGGNNRSIFEALLANTRHVFACLKNRRKHIVLIPTKEHMVGEISVLTDAELSAAISTANQPTDDIAWQLITYGAPGTGKSHRTKLETDGHIVYRTTFHPDSDYSTFVGAYKPTMKTKPRVAMINDGKDAVKAGGEDDLKMVDEITYEFVPQAFAKAYVAAWKAYVAKQGAPLGNADRVYLVIEEINRGNCAQIFGDIFQLLDRGDKGFSNYPIDADADLANWLHKQFGGGRGATALTGEDSDRASGHAGRMTVPDGVASGKKLMLPPNLYIRATMNTSDQSLFPIDSAFKRRWDWEYVPIKDEGKNYKIKVDVPAIRDSNNNVIQQATSCEYDWWSFLQKINDIVYDETQSADKQMGYFFVKLPDGQTEISLKTFVNKVAFYLWNDVFKDCEIRDDALKLKGSDGKPGEPIKFTDFFLPYSNKLNVKVVKDLLDGLGVEKIEPTPEENQSVDSTPAASEET